MSYCRWSSDNWKSAVYCYEDIRGGWTTHVAGNKVVGDVPEELDMLTVPVEEYVESHKAVMAFLETAERKPIGLPYDGETFNDPDLEEFRARLVMLRDAGYHVPKYVFTEIEDEMKETAPESAAPNGGS